MTNHKATQQEYVHHERKKNKFMQLQKKRKECLLNANSKVHNVIYKYLVSAIQTFKEHVYMGIAVGNWKHIVCIGVSPPFKNNPLILANHPFKSANCPSPPF